MVVLHELQLGGVFWPVFWFVNVRFAARFYLCTILGLRLLALQSGADREQ